MESLVFSQFNCVGQTADNFREWCAERRFPSQVNMSGFAAAALYDGVDAPSRFLICDFLSDVGLLENPTYRTLDPTLNASASYVCDGVSSAGSEETAYCLYVVAFDVPHANADEFDEWYESEHVPLLLSVPGWLGVRRYAVRSSVNGPSWTRLALHSLRDRSVLVAPERKVAQAVTARVASLRMHSWFDAKSRGRWLYELNRRISRVDSLQWARVRR